MLWSGASVEANKISNEKAKDCMTFNLSISLFSPAHLFPVSMDPNFANLTDMTPLNPPFEGGKFSPPPLEGELEGVNLDLLSMVTIWPGRIVGLY